MSDDAQLSDAGSWIGRNGWVLAAVWLVFLVFPLLSILGNDDIARPAQIVGTALIIAFAAVYIHGFRCQHRAEQAAGGPWSTVGEPHYTGRGHAGLLIAITVVLCLVVGPAGLGVIAFVVAFAVFHFDWLVAWIALIAGIAVTLLVPLAVGALDDLWFLAMIVIAVGVASMLIRNVETTEADRSTLRTQLAVSGERNRVARDVHDVLGHSLTAVILKAELCQRLLDGVDPRDDDQRNRVSACREQLGELHGIGRSALAEIRSTVGGLRAVNLADEVTVARTVLADAGVGLTVTGEITAIAEEHRPLLAWVVREAVVNVVRHASASNCHIELGPDLGVDAVVLRVADDGVGLSPADRRGMITGNGLRGVRERVEAVGGELVVRSDAGTILEVAL